MLTAVWGKVIEADLKNEVAAFAGDRSCQRIMTVACRCKCNQRGDGVSGFSRTEKSRCRLQADETGLRRGCIG